MVGTTGEGPGFVDRLLEARGQTRRVALRVAQFHTALAVVAASDLVLSAPGVLALLIGETQGVVSLRPPLPIPKHSVSLVWHERFTKDPGHVWLRGLIADVARPLQANLVA